MPEDAVAAVHTRNVRQADGSMPPEVDVAVKSKRARLETASTCWRVAFAGAAGLLVLFADAEHTRIRSASADAHIVEDVPVVADSQGTHDARS